MYPHKRARKAGNKIAAADKLSCNCEHSHINKYILSPCDIDLCRVIRFKPTDFGR